MITFYSNSMDIWWIHDLLLRSDSFFLFFFFGIFCWFLHIVSYSLEYFWIIFLRITYVLGGNYPWEFWVLKWSFSPLEKIFVCFFQIPSSTRNLHHLYCKFMIHFNVLTVQCEFLAAKSTWHQSELLLHKVNSML